MKLSWILMNIIYLKILKLLNKVIVNLLKIIIKNYKEYKKKIMNLISNLMILSTEVMRIWKMNYKKRIIPLLIHIKNQIILALKKKILYQELVKTILVMTSLNN